MAVSLGLSLSQGTPNEESRTTTVTARVTINYSDGSYNGNSPSGTLTIDGQSFSFSKSFNYAGAGQGPSTTGSGSTTAYTKTITVSYGSASTRTVYASASFASGTASGTVTASNSINLTPISGDDSGGDSGGGDSGDSGGGYVDPEYPYVYKLNYVIGEHCAVKVYLGQTLVYTINKSGSIGTYKSKYPMTYTFIFVADDGYKLSGCSVDGVACDSEGKLTAYNGTYTIIASAVPCTSSDIDIVTDQYECYIDTEYEVYTSYTSDCTFEGHSYVDIEGSINPEYFKPPQYYTAGSAYMGYGNMGSPYRALYFLKFTMHNLGRESVCLNFSIPFFHGGATWSCPVKYWLSSSDSNYLMYANGCESDYTIPDEYMILSGSFFINEDDEEIKLTLNTTYLESNTTYYLILYAPPYNNGYSFNTQMSLVVPTMISVNYVDEPLVGTESEFVRYECYIDNGTSWVPYDMYIETIVS